MLALRKALQVHTVGGRRGFEEANEATSCAEGHSAGYVPGATRRIFISYRREDGFVQASRLYDALSARFGEHAILMDIDAIRPGEDYRESIRRAVGRADAMLVLVGDQWLTNASGRRRLEDPDDFVRLEVASGLELGIDVVPVLVKGASMPQRNDLPMALAGLVERDPVSLSDHSWRADFGGLIERLGHPQRAGSSRSDEHLQT